MQPSSHGPFTPVPIVRRTHFAWPEGNRLALWVVPNLEYFHLDDPLPGIHNERVPAASARVPDVRSWSIREYGNRVGVWRVFDVLSRYGIRGTAALNSDLCDVHPETIERALALGWEFMGHCQSNALRLNEMPPAAEGDAIHATLERIAAATGAKPKGWLGAGVAETWNTLDFLIVVAHRETGEFFRYDQKIEMNLMPATKERLAAQWFPIVRDFELAPGGYQAKIVVRDKNSGKIGTVIHEFEVADLSQFRTSTPVITDTLQPDQEKKDVPRPAIIVRRTFAPGTTLFASFEVYGATKEKPTGMPKVSAGYVVRRADGSPVVEVAPSRINPTSLGKLSRIVGTRLPAEATGDLEFVLSVKDEISGKTLEVKEPFTVAAGAAKAAAPPTGE